VKQRDWRPLLAAGLLLGAACRPGKILQTPLPERIRSIEGYASLRIIEGGESTRSKFAFFLESPNRGRIEVSNFLAGTVYRMIFAERAAFFVVPSRRVFWEGTEEEVLDRFLGFPLSLEEVARLFSGRWPDPQPEDWALQRDGAGRVVSGARGELRFAVEEFLDGSVLPAGVTFSHSRSRGRLSMLRIAFNVAPRDGTFSLGFRDQFQRKTWDEILELIHDPD
jgi:hypothetical protein